MGAFNDWTRGTYLEKPEHRRIVDVSLNLLHGSAFYMQKSQGSPTAEYTPVQML
jgi:hypothetical protein